MSKKRHLPERTCLGCGNRDEQVKLMRLTVTPEGELKIDDHQGRGGYLHHQPKCWQAFLSRKSHYRAFRVEINREQRERLIRHLKDRDQE